VLFLAPLCRYCSCFAQLGNLRCDRFVNSAVSTATLLLKAKQLGWRTVSASVRYLKQPAVLTIENSTLLEPEPEPTDRLSILRRKYRKPAEQPPPVIPHVQFQGEFLRLAEPVMAELYVDQLLDRDEFRRHCDRNLTRERIVANL
jgi:hypothetical protein